MPNVTKQGNKIPLELEVALGSTVVPGDIYVVANVQIQLMYTLAS